MLDAFKVKPFDLDPIYAELKIGPIFTGNPKKDPPVDEWLEQIKAICVQRNVPEEYWYKVAQHFMGPQAKARFDELKQVIAKVNGGKYRWSWKKFKIAMSSMGWDMDKSATETIKVDGKIFGVWFIRKKEEKEKEELVAEPEPISRAPPIRSNFFRISRKPTGNESQEEASQPSPRRSATESSTIFWPIRRNSKNENSDSMDDQKPAHKKPISDTLVLTQGGSKSLAPARSSTEKGEAVTTISQVPIWLLNACTALDYITSEHPKAMSVLSAILITVGSIPAIPAISAGAGGVVLASGTAHAIGAIAVGLGQALNSSVVAKSSNSEHKGSHTPASSVR